jgi:hypothetical protein
MKLVVVWMPLLILLGPAALGASGEELDFFESRIRPVLVETCWRCHGGDKVSSGLRLASRDALLRGGERGSAVVPGDPERSLLIQALRQTHEELRMPPKGRLPASVVADFERWVADGAPWPSRAAELIRGPPAAAAALSPGDEPLRRHLELWLRADGAPWKDGQAVHVWPDSSGRGRDLSPTEGARPGGTGGPAQFALQSTVHGFPALRFSAATGLAASPDNPLPLLGDAEFTAVAVACLKPNPESNADCLLGFGDPAWKEPAAAPYGAIVGIGHSAEEQLVLAGGWGHDAGLGAGTFAPFYARPCILTVVRRPGPLAATVEFFVNGAALSPQELQGSVQGSQAPLDLRRRSDIGAFMGRAQGWAGGVAGDIAEVAVFSRTLSAGERDALETHFSRKFRIPLAAPRGRMETSSENGDAAQRHWSFQPVRPHVPPPDPERWSESGLDAFVAARRRESGLEVVGAADRGTLLRRLAFNLSGLPPSPEEVEAHLADESPDACDRAADRLLASPRYGERSGRHWLDVARYADTAGDNADYPVPEARLYRDWVIDAFNADKPYDEFVREQLAGDILAREGPRERYAERVSATGFLALSRRYATAPYEFWHLTLEDTIDTVGQALLGLTLRCARCHDHKYDPVTSADYYALYGIFESTQYPWAGGEELASKGFPREHFVPLEPPETAVLKLRAHEERLRSLEKEAAQAANEGEKKKKESERRALERWGLPPDLPGAYAVAEGVPRHATIQRRGDPEQPGPVVERGAIAFLCRDDPLRIATGESGRRQLAEWMARPGHPLTARVAANRVWQHLFGKGLVSTPSNFGVRGAAPTHPELLDWLAAELVRGGWSMKSLQRRILGSRTWKLASAPHPASSAADPGNSLLWRHDRRRLEAEAIRDAMLAVSGRLELSRPSEHPFPPLRDWGFTQHNQFRAVYPSQHRSVYLMTQRLQRHPFLALFDGPDTNTTTEKRTSATVPLQALYLMNSPELGDVAAAAAKELVSACGGRDERVRLAYERAYSRSPSQAEAARAAEFLGASLERLAAAGVPAESRELEAWTSFCRLVFIANEFFYVD